MRNFIVILAVLLLVGAVVILTIGDREEIEAEPRETEEVGEGAGNENEEQSLAVDLANIAYPIEGESIELTEGAAETETEEGVMMTELVETAEGDLNDDGEPDGVVVLAQDPGGTGIFYYVVGVLSEDGAGETTEAVFIGDRVIIESLSVNEGGVVEVAFLTRAEDEPFAAEPTVAEALRLRLEGGDLVEEESE